MAKKNQNPEVQTEQTEQAMTSKRERRVKTSSVLPTEANAWQGSVTVEVVNSDTHTFNYSTPELPEWLVRAIDVGIKSRVANVIAGETDVAKISSLVLSEFAAFTSGKFAVRASKVASEAVFNNSIVALAMLTKVESLKDVTFDVVEATLNDVESLTAARDSWAATEDKKSFEGKLFNVCKSIVSTYRKMQEDQEV